MISLDAFQRWLDAYGQAWIDGDPAAVVQLFAAEAAYYEVPWAAPMVGRAAIRQYWTEGAQESQTAITFQATPIAVVDGCGYAHWQATYQRVPAGTFVELDGILAAWFDEEGRCTLFREWWHRRESGRESAAPPGV